MELVDQVGPDLYKNETYLRQPIPVHKRIACGLYLLGSTFELRTVGNLFGVGKTIAAAILHEFCNILVDKCFHRFIKFPTTDDEIKDTTDEFLIKSGYPMWAPGRCNDSSAFTCSKLYGVMQNQMYANQYIMINNVKLHANLIADSAFPLSTTLLKPYSDRSQMPKKYSLFNYRLSRCRGSGSFSRQSFHRPIVLPTGTFHR
ncbi:unnamed protein product [Adineta steineri]|uniref:DDE Tnp4 domain-containing protein n=1 Tax=Adineta steineri TaxID=433720 RepID=A0A815BW87_9BILA|nr:unnamed protein product [Adineta steineri]